jgi:hypothetical protein
MVQQRQGEGKAFPRASECALPRSSHTQVLFLIDQSINENLQFFPVDVWI